MATDPFSQLPIRQQMFYSKLLLFLPGLNYFNSISGLFSMMVFLCTMVYGQAQSTSHRIQKNSIGIDMVTIGKGSFMQGSEDADFDEKPVRRTTIGSSYQLSATEITNEQYEKFDTGHRRWRGKFNTSFQDDDPVVFVSWDDANAFCKWLSEKEHKHYRLPTEAEWEFACRAGTRSRYYTGDTLPNVYKKDNGTGGMGGYPVASPDPRLPAPNLQVGKTPPNAWGLFDMHGNVEEWCYDWYAPYQPGPQTDPAGAVSGDFKVTRGGSHTSEFEVVIKDADPMKSISARYLTSSNRMASLKEDRNWLIGFRIAAAPPVNEKKLASLKIYTFNRSQVNQAHLDLASSPAADKNRPYFEGPVPYVIPPAPSATQPPFYYHNHQPAITELPNGDLMAIWYNTLRESGRELKIMASRKRYGHDEWDTASVFLDAPDHNEHGTAIWWNGWDTVFHFFGYAAANTWDTLALAMRVSTDNGASWSTPKFINPEYGAGNQVIASVIRDQQHRIIFTCDATPRGAGGSVIWISSDEGRTWSRTPAISKTPAYEEGATGPLIAGIHASIVSLPGGALMALGRSDNIKNTQAKSISLDGGKTWKYGMSGLFPISSGQRCTLQQLVDGRLFLASFAPSVWFTDDKGLKHVGSGLFAALSEDGGKTFPFVRLVVNEKKPGMYNGWGWQHAFEMTYDKAEPVGYLTSTVTRNGLIHLISSGNEYIFNEAWIRALPPAGSKK